MADTDSSQIYESREAIDRIYRSFRGDVLTTDSPNSLPGTRRPIEDVLSRLAELIQNSLPGETLTLPASFVTAISTQFPSATGTVSPNTLYEFGVTTSYFRISASGTLTLGGSASVWDDLRFPATASKLGGSKDPGFSLFKFNGTGSQGVFTYWFDESTEEEVYLIAQMPHGWKLGSLVYPHVHWTPASNGTGTVSWGLEYTWGSINSLFSPTSINYANATTVGFANISGSIHYMTELPALTGTSQGLSSMLAMRLFRNATGGGGSGDSYPHDAGLLEFDIHYEIDAFGSNERNTK